MRHRWVGDLTLRRLARLKKLGRARKLIVAIPDGDSVGAAWLKRCFAPPTTRRLRRLENYLLCRGDI